MIAGFGSRQEVEQWLNNHISLALVSKMSKTQKDLEKLRHDLESWTRQYVASELVAHRSVSVGSEEKQVDTGLMNYNDVVSIIFSAL